MSEKQNPRKVACYVPWQNMIVGADGNVSPCSFYQGFGNDHPFIGNVNEQSITEIWNGPGYQNLRRFMLSEEGKNGCKDCLAIKQGVCGKPMAPPPEFLQENPAAYDSKAMQNLQLVLRDIDEGKTATDALPASISYTNSHACNFRCTMCYQDSSRSLRLDRVKLIDQEILALMDTLIQVIAGGGEPFMLPVWKRFLKEYHRERNPVLTFATTTNGSFLDPETLELVKKFPNVILNFSLDATHKELFEAIRLRSNWDEVHQNLMNCLAHRGPTHNRRFYVSACMTVMRSNFAEIPAFLRMMSRHHMRIGFSPLNVFPVDEAINMFNDVHKDLRDFRAVLDEAKHLFATDEVLLEPGYQAFLKHMEAIENIIPFGLLDMPHHEVTGTLPAGKKALVDPLEIEGVPWRVAIFEPTEGATKYWAPVERDGSFTVKLPVGKFLANLTRRNLVPSPDPTWQLEVSPGSKVLRSTIIDPDANAPVLLRMRRSLARRLPGRLKTAIRWVLGMNQQQTTPAAKDECGTKRCSA